MTLRVIAISAVSAASVLLAGCVMGIPDSGPAVRKAKPCEKYIIVEPDHKAVCMTREEFDRWMRKNLPTNY